MERAGPGDNASGVESSKFSNLGQRAMSGAVLAAVAALLLYLGQSWFALFVTAVAITVCWEWGRIVRERVFDTPFFVHAATVLAAALLTISGNVFLALAVVIMGAVVITATQFGKEAYLSAIGVLYTGLPTIALLWLRGDEPFGFLAVLFVVTAVAATDIAAYISGRLVGGAKLWPSISPKKTWAGLIGGLLASGLTGVLFGLIIVGESTAWLSLLGVAIGFVSQLGDLAESALKRHFGVKDASELLPGHGGFMDRMDGVVAAAILAAIAGILIDAYAPARAVVLGS